MRTEIKKSNSKKHVFLIFDNEQKFRIEDDGNIKHTKEMLDLAIDFAKIKWKTEEINKDHLMKEIRGNKFLNDMFSKGI